MTGYIVLKQAAEQWGITPRRILVLIHAGKIEGAEKMGHTWVIPADTQKPPDPRIARKERGEPYHINAKKKPNGGKGE